MQTHNNKIPASSLPDRSGADKAQNRLTEEIPEGMVPGEIHAFMKWSARCYKAVHEFMVAYNQKAREAHAMVMNGNMTVSESKASLREYERLDEEYERLISRMKEIEAGLREKYGEKYFPNR